MAFRSLACKLGVKLRVVRSFLLLALRFENVFQLCMGVQRSKVRQRHRVRLTDSQHGMYVYYGNTDITLLHKLQCKNHVVWTCKATTHLKGVLIEVEQSREGNLVELELGIPFNEGDVVGGVRDTKGPPLVLRVVEAVANATVTRVGGVDCSLL